MTIKTRLKPIGTKVAMVAIALTVTTGCSLNGEIKAPGTQSVEVEKAREETKRIEAMTKALAEALAALKPTPTPSPSPEAR